MDTEINQIANTEIIWLCHLAKTGKNWFHSAKCGNLCSQLGVTESWNKVVQYTVHSFTYFYLIMYTYSVCKGQPLFWYQRNSCCQPNSVFIIGLLLVAINYPFEDQCFQQLSSIERRRGISYKELLFCNLWKAMAGILQYADQKNDDKHTMIGVAGGVMKCFSPADRLLLSAQRNWEKSSVL